jgi:hypothetical protein
MQHAPRSEYLPFIARFQENSERSLRASTISICDTPHNAHTSEIKLLEPVNLALSNIDYSYTFVYFVPRPMFIFTHERQKDRQALAMTCSIGLRG